MDKPYNGAMPNFSLKDDEIAAVLSYVRSNFGNSGTPVTVAEVQRIRGAAVRETASDRR